MSMLTIHVIVYLVGAGLVLLAAYPWQRKKRPSSKALDAANRILRG